MLALRDLQAAFAAQLAGGDRPDLAEAVVGDSITAAARLRIHRHHVAESLATALAATYSTVQAIVGEDFFRIMARDFAAADLPRQPVLAEYGEAFPAFVAGYGPAASLPYLADMARLDWALNLAFHAPWHSRLTVSDLADLPPEGLLASRVSLAAGSTLVRSAYPIDRIWHASRPGTAAGRVSLDEGRAAVIVLRRADDAAFATLSPAEAAFVEALDDGKTLEEGAQAAFATEPAFDLSTSVARLLALQAFAALQQDC
mgnify:CR=1 FL=1